jgi:hypothetical protein
MSQYVAMSMLGVKVRPTSHAPVAMNRRPRFSLYHQIQQGKANKGLHSTHGSKGLDLKIWKNVVMDYFNAPSLDLT